MPSRSILRGIPFEHIIGSYCPDDIQLCCRRSCSLFRTHPRLPIPSVSSGCQRDSAAVRPRDPRAQCLETCHSEDFATFMGEIKSAATIAREAYDSQETDESAKRWHDLFGDPFPYDEDDEGRRQSFIPPAGPSRPSTQRYG